MGLLRALAGAAAPAPASPSAAGSQSWMQVISNQRCMEPRPAGGEATVNDPHTQLGMGGSEG
jgi:hypothetical protein